MKVRKMTAEGDYQLGRGNHLFFMNSAEGVCQNVQTRLALWRGSWFLDLRAGTPWIQEILGKHDAVDIVLRDRILTTPGVLEILEFEAILNPDNRRITINATLKTRYGTGKVRSEI